jgi:predicted secreted protein
VRLLPSVAIYFVIWWLCLFVVLPFGANSQHETGEVPPGTDASAPTRLYILRRVAATTLLAAIIFGGVYLYFGVYGKTLEDLVW